MIRRILDFLVISALLSVAVMFIGQIQQLRDNSGGDQIRDELGAVIYVPENYAGEPIPTSYWLSWCRGSVHAYPPMYENPKFNREAMWKTFDVA